MSDVLPVIVLSMDAVLRTNRAAERCPHQSQEELERQTHILTQRHGSEALTDPSPTSLQKKLNEKALLCTHTSHRSV